MNKSPTPEKRFVPDKYINTIKYRIPRRTIWIQEDSPIEANFATWEEAHAWIVERRMREFAAAEAAMQSAKHSLLRARVMKPKPGTQW